MTNVLIVEARYYTRIADMQLEGAKKALEKAGAQYDVITVPGALEIPLAILFAAKAAEGAGKGYDGYVALGCIMRGETYHFEIVSNESARGLTNLGLQHGLCIGNGILTVENEEQALVRAVPTDGEDSDKGGGAARACLALIEIRNKFGAHR